MMNVFLLLFLLRAAEDVRRAAAEDARRQIQEVYRRGIELITGETKVGIEDFVNDNVEELQGKAQRSARTKNGLDQTVTCSSCSTEELTRIDPAQGRTSTASAAKPCGNNICNEMMEAFRKDHQFRKPNWRNSDATKWGTDPIEVAKLFMPPGYKDKITKFESIDLHGYLNVLVNCKTARGKLSDPKIAVKAKEFSSRVRHMSEDTITIGDFVEGADTFLKLLNNPAIIKYPKAVESVNNIEKIIADVMGLEMFDLLRKSVNVSRRPMPSTDAFAMTKSVFQTKDGLCEFAIDALRDLQYSTLTKVRIKQCLTSDDTCDQCSTEDLIPPKQRRGKTRYLPCCPIGYCDSIRDFLVEEHVFNAPFWSNTDATKWSTDPWELAKVFMQHGYKDAEGAFVVDLNGPINIINNCKQMSIQLIDPDCASKARAVTRKRRHADHLEVSKEDFKEAVDVYTELLNEPAIAKHARAQMALKVIEEKSKWLEE